MEKFLSSQRYAEQKNKKTNGKNTECLATIDFKIYYRAIASKEQHSSGIKQICRSIRQNRSTTQVFVTTAI